MPDIFKLPVILASRSVARLELLKKIGITPSYIIKPVITPADIVKYETGIKFAARRAKEKAELAADEIVDEVADGIIIGVHTIAVAGRKIIGKARSQDEVKACLIRLSGRRHQVYTSIYIIKKHQDHIYKSHRTVKTIIKFRKISTHEIDYCYNSGEGIGKTGGYDAAGYGGAFISFISGSYSAVLGLPLCETVSILEPMGLRVHIQ